MKRLAQRYLASLYQRTMREAYADCRQRIVAAPGSPLRLLECGAGTLKLRATLEALMGQRPLDYTGMDWSARVVENGLRQGMDVRRVDLNAGIPAESSSFDCISALSLIEHLLNPCRFMSDAYRVLRPGGRLVVLTPNISTFFTAALVLMGRMPSSGPHPDSSALVRGEEIVRVNTVERTALEDDCAEHRHLVVFSFIVLRRYLSTIGFEDVQGRGYGLYPFPNFMQAPLERIDPYHCHQMVFTAVKPGVGQ